MCTAPWPLLSLEAAFLFSAEPLTHVGESGRQVMDWLPTMPGNLPESGKQPNRCEAQVVKSYREVCLCVGVGGKQVLAAHPLQGMQHCIWKVKNHNPS